MVDVQLYCHAIWSGPRIPIYSDYYLPERSINRGQDRVWGLDVWRDLQERRRWAMACGPNLSLEINVPPRRRRTRSSGKTETSDFMLGLSHGIYLTHRIKRPCTVEIPCPRISVNIRDGVCLYSGRAWLERVPRRSQFSPAVVVIHLDLPDEESFRKFKDLSNHLARVVEEPDDRGFYFWFIRRGQWNTPIRGSCAYFIDLNGKHKKYKIHGRDCIKFVVVLNERNHLSSPRSSASSSSSQHRSARTNSNKPPPPPPRRVRTEERDVQTTRVRTEERDVQTTRVRTEERDAQTIWVRTEERDAQTKRVRTEERDAQTTRVRTEERDVQTTRHQTDKHDPVFEDDEVLARWEDDRWYYKGRIIQCMDNDHYNVKDATGRYDIISREDIIRIADHYDTVSSQKRACCCVLAPHPIYYWSYAPGRVMETVGQHLTVRFYDNNEESINRWDVYPARNREKHDTDVADIRQREKDWEGQKAFIRDESGVYRLGTVEQQIGRQQKYSVRWDDGQCGEQMSIHIYGPYTRMIKFKVGSYILALADPERVHYLPGQVRNVHGDGDGQRLEVEFVSGRSSKDVLSRHSYWMNTMAFHEAEKVFLRHHQDSSDGDPSRYL